MTLFPEETAIHANLAQMPGTTTAPQGAGAASVVHAYASGQYDLVLAVECIHDMSDPARVLTAMRRLVGDGGTALVIDEKVADRFTAPGDEVERSTAVCRGGQFFHREGSADRA